MDHDTVVRNKMTERYLLDELDTQTRDEFEEHYFDCRECAEDVQAGAVFVEQSKAVLAEPSKPVTAPRPAAVPGQAAAGWRVWFRPAILIPVMAILLVVVAYQNLVLLPQMDAALHQPQVMPWAAVNVGTYGAEGPVVKVSQGQGFLLFVRIPPEGIYTRYTAELYNPAGKVEWKVTIPAASSSGAANEERASNDQWPLAVPAANREAGTYSLAVSGNNSAGESKEIGRASFELQVQK